jgi:hypothetical protein
MTTHNLFELYLKDSVAKHPEVFNLSGLDEKIAATVANSQAITAINTEARAQKDAEGLELEREYNALRLQFHNLREDARCCEIRVKEHAAKICNIEKELQTLRVILAAADNPRLEKAIKHRISLHEGELADTKDLHHRAVAYNRSAVKMLRTFDQKRLSALFQQIQEKRKPKPADGVSA